MLQNNQKNKKAKAIFLYRIHLQTIKARWLRRNNLLSSTLCSWGGYIELADNVFIGQSVQLTAWDNYRGHSYSPSITVGNNSSIGDDSHVTAINRISIGNNVRMGKRILITDNAHGASDPNLLDIAPNYRPLVSKGPVVIEDNVWIGEKSSIMPGVTIGRGSIIGANSVVTKDIPPYCVVGGIPAIVIKTLRP